ncbi:MAG: hypothetical protein H7Y38_11400, partial [Armatimonadetes bacterium]|nr:hypothetical protein [Armatimonadota bacterium]
METTKQGYRVATKSSFLPVLLPVFIFIGVACAARGIQEFTPSYRPSQSLLTARVANPTEAT